MRFRASLLFAVVALAGAGGCSSSWASQATAGPNYSTVPCADNCGGDAQCVAKCTPAGNNPPPAGLMPRGH